MKNLRPITFGIALIFITAGCGGQPEDQVAASSAESVTSVGQSGIQDQDSNPNVVQVAVSRIT